MATAIGTTTTYKQTLLSCEGKSRAEMATHANAHESGGKSRAKVAAQANVHEMNYQTLPWDGAFSFVAGDDHGDVLRAGHLPMDAPTPAPVELSAVYHWQQPSPRGY